MKNILITGGAGYIGAHMVYYLLERGVNVFVLDNFSNSDRSRIEAISKSLNKKIPIIEHDITNSLKDIKFNVQLDGIIHFAALKSVPESIEKPFEYYHNNNYGTLNVIDWALKNKVKNLVFSSTCAVYGNTEESVIKEDTPTDPFSVYGKTKLFSENMLEDVSKASNDFNVVSLRYFNVVGNLDSGLIGDNVDSPAILPSILRAYFNKDVQLEIYGNNYDTKDGTPVRDYIHVEDLVDAHFKSLEFLLNNKGFKIFNIGTGTGYTLLELIETFESIVGEKLDYIVKDRKPGDVGKAVADSDLAKKLLKWIPEKNLEDIFRSMLKSYESKGLR